MQRNHGLIGFGMDLEQDSGNSSGAKGFLPAGFLSLLVYCVISRKHLGLELSWYWKVDLVSVIFRSRGPFKSGRDWSYLVMDKDSSDVRCHGRTNRWRNTQSFIRNSVNSSTASCGRLIVVIVPIRD